MWPSTQDSDRFQAFCPWASPVTAEHEAEEGTTVLPSMEEVWEDAKGTLFQRTRLNSSNSSTLDRKDWFLTGAVVG